MTTVSIDEALAKLSELLERLAPGEDIIITKNNQPVGRLIGIAEPKKRKLGTRKRTVTYMAPEFDAPLDEFKEYME